MLLAPFALIAAAVLTPLAGSPPLELSPVSARAVAATEAVTLTATASETDLFTLLDYFDAGQQRALRYLDRLAPAAREQFRIADVAGACVRVSCQRDGGRSVVFSSGVLVNGGRRVVTAGHGIGAVGEAAVDMSVVLSDGREIPARVVSRSAIDSSEQDWAVLELTGPLPANMASVHVGSARPGGLAFILGYPERVGLGADGHAAASLASQAMALDPLLFVARVPPSAEPSFEPLAGAVPLSGASGSPVFDERGALVGVLVAIGRLAYPDGVRHVYRVSLSGDFEAALRS